ncbi:MAG: hypothetical protein JO368_04195 [Acidimicrobiales bacterium]|nr:hypothetical protein [Acidimicrobiales bacterium]
MALVIIIAVAWLVILIPSFLRRRSAGDENVSISHFHHQLQILEHSAPQPLVAPAYRLCADGDERAGTAWSRPPAAATLTVVGARDLPRPNLAFLAEDPAAPAPSRSLPAPAATGIPGPAALDARPRPDTATRRLARQRRRDTLCVLVLAFVLTFMIGFVPGASLAWVAAGLFGVALAGYVALLVNLRRRAEERERKLRYLPPARPAPAALEEQALDYEGSAFGSGVLAVR